MDFNKYSGEVSKKVMEESCFQAVMHSLAGDNSDILHFDISGMDGLPDCYLRKGNSIFIFEFKAIIVPEQHLQEVEVGTTKTRFDEFKTYLDERFIESKKGSPKGVSQLRNQISLLKQDGRYSFDPGLTRLLANGQVTIYPVICHNDFNFTMPGINEYLNIHFIPAVLNLQKDNFIVREMTMISLDYIFDLVLWQGDIDTMKKYIDLYWSMIAERGRELLADKLHADPLPSRRSFDELYTTRFIHDLPDLGSLPHALDNLLYSAGITQSFLEETV